ncbi:MAG: ATP synthase F1 subunit gamma [Myxococcota bacterium]
MPSLKIIRRRITSTKSTQKITRAMKLVAAARLRRAQDGIIAARPYARRLHEVITELAARADATDHPLLERREPRRVALVVITSDRGLCGGFNTNILRRADAFLRDGRASYEAIDLSVVGRKGREYYRHRHVALRREFPGSTSDVAQERAREIARAIIDEFLAQNLDAAYLVYNEFKSAVTQKVTVERLLPIEPLPLVGLASVDFLYEPGKRELLDHLLPLHVEVQLYRAVLESIASELGSRMTAMESATNNASDMIQRLTLQFNRARQATITKELMEIIGGAEALKG